MVFSRSRLIAVVAGLAVLLALLTLLALSASAGAEITASDITSPADPTFALEDEPAKTGELTITGNVTGTGNVALRCYYGNAVHAVAEGIEPEGGKFSVTMPLSEFPEAPCVLRAVSESDVSPRPPASAQPFTGPRVGASIWTLESDPGLKTRNDYVFTGSTLSTFMIINSAGHCGLEFTGLFAPSSLAASLHLFECNGALLLAVPVGGKRAEIQLDGVNAYDPFSAERLHTGVNTKGPMPEITVTKSFDPTTGLIAIHEVDPLVVCVGKTTAFPESEASCESFAPAGVTLERDWRPTAGGGLIYMTDSWRSTNGKAHDVSADYTQEFLSDNPEFKTPGVLEVPGTAGFAPTKSGESLPIAAGAGALVYKENSESPEAGDLAHPFGAVVYDAAPGEPSHVYAGSADHKLSNGLYMPYHLSIPAGGAQALRMAFAEDLALPTVRTLAAQALASFRPTVAIGSPANGSKVSAPTVTVSGSATDSGALAAVSVNGHPATLSPNGSWTIGVPLAAGTNTITATATDQAGLTASASITLTHPSAPPGPPPNTIKIGAVKVRNGQITFGITCKGPAGSSCVVKALLSTTEHLRKGRVTALSTRAKTRRVTVGALRLTIAAGRHGVAVLKLNATGRRLLRRFHKLPGKLTVTLIGAGGRGTVALAKKVVVTPPPHRRHR